MSRTALFYYLNVVDGPLDSSYDKRDAHHLYVGYPSCSETERETGSMRSCQRDPAQRIF